MKKTNAFDWDIKETGILDINGNPIKGYKQITRDDNGDNIAVMKNSFHPMTTQQFSDTANEVAEKIGGTIQEFKEWEGGKPIVTAQMKVSEPMSIAGSQLDGVLTIGVGFDGGRSFFIGHTNTYLRCTNQFHTIVKDFTSRLTRNNLVRIEEIIQNIETYRDYEKKLYENFQKFQEVTVDEKIIQECVARLIGLTQEERAMTPEELENALSTQKRNKRDEIFSSLRGEVEALGSNAWGLFNGVTHYTTHVMKGSDVSSMFGAKNTANQIAYNMGLELINA